MRFSITGIYLTLLFYVSPFVDAISGYLILSGVISEGGAGSPSQLFRLIIMIISLYLISNNKKYFYSVSIISLYIFMLESISFQLHQNLVGYIVGLVYASKIVYLIIVFLTIYYLAKIERINFYVLLNYLHKYFLLMAILLIIPFLAGIGYPTYGEGTFGTKGFFAAGNGLGVFMGVGILLSIFYWKYTREKYSLMISFILIFASIIIGTKTSFIFSVSGLLFIVYFLKNKYLSFLLSALTLSTLFIFFQEIVDLLNIVFDVVSHRFQNNNSFVSFLMSNRDVYFMDALDHISYNGMYVLRILFGMGVFLSFRNPGEYFSGIDTLESDFADIFFIYGVFAIVFYMFIFFYILKLFINKKQYFLGFIFIMLFLHSIIGGHVVFNGMSGVLLPLMATLAFLNKRYYRTNI